MLRIFCLSLIVLISLPASAKEKDFVSLDRFRGGDLGSWTAGDGDLIWTNLGCAASSNYSDAFNDPPPVKSPPVVHEPYQFRISDDSGGGYHFYLDNDPSNTGNAKISAAFEHRDVKVGTGFETLSDGVYDSHSHTGQFKKCNNGDNSEVRLTLTGLSLSNTRAGKYQGNFRAEMIGGSSGTKTKQQKLKMKVNIAQIVRVSSLDNITLGNWSSGLGDLNGDETFCVYSNNDAAEYTIGISSPNTSGGVFRLGNGTLTEYVDYDLVFADSLGGIGTAVGAGTNPGTGSNTAADCGGVDNARVSVAVTAVNLGAATPDSYSDTITLMVAPL